MKSTIFFSISAIIYILLLLIVFFSKKYYKTLENKIYSLLIITSFFGLVIELLGVFILNNTNEVLSFIQMKLYQIYLLTWIGLFTLYTIASTKRNNKENKVSPIVILFYIISVIIIFILPTKLYNNNNSVYTYGASINYLYFYSLGCIIIIVYKLLSNIRKMFYKKYLPMSIFLLLGVITMIIQSKNPSLLLMSSTEAFITFLMYFTIENPDIKLINELELAKDNLENANLVKSEFLRSMSHEIRTPMNQIIGCASVIEMEDNLSKESKDVLNDLVNSTNSLLDVCNGIINVSQIESGNVDILISGYNPKEIIEDLVNLNRKRLTNKDIEIVSNYSELPDVVYGDKDKVKQIVSNLLSNAIKYTDKGKIEISVSGSVKKDKCDIEIVVKDTGKGISEDNIDLIFNKFGKLEKNSDTLGLGLGLFITKNLVNILGGNISVTSELGKGSEFKVVLQENLVDTSTKLDLSSVNLMIIHSSNMIRAFLKNSIMKYEIKVNDFSNGVDAINELKKVDYDIVIVDKYISDVRVEELVRTIKEDISSNIKIMVIGNQENIDYVDMFISEELNMNDIINNIKKVLS